MAAIPSIQERNVPFLPHIVSIKSAKLKTDRGADGQKSMDFARLVQKKTAKIAKKLAQKFGVIKTMCYICLDIVVQRSYVFYLLYLTAQCCPP